MPVPPNLSQKDGMQVLRAVIDDTTNRLMVDAIISPDGHDLEIHHEDDSIAIGTPTELFTATDIGPKVALDVNVANTAPIPVTGTIVADNTANGNTGSPVPVQATQVGGENTSGNLQALQLDASGNLKTTATVVVPGTVSVTQGTTPWVDNITEIGGSPIALGQTTSSASLPVVIASDQSPVPVSGTVTADQGGTWNIDNITGTVSLPTGASTSTLQTATISELMTINTTLGSPFQAGGSIGNTSFIATQSSGSNLHVNVDNFPAIQPVSGTVTALQGTSPWVVSGTVTTSPNVNIYDSAGNALTSTTGSLNVNVTDFPATQAVTQSGTWTVSTKSTPTTGTITNAAITVGTTAVRATVSGSAPASTRSVLLVSPDSADTGKFYMGSSTVTSSGPTAGFQLLAGDQVAFNNDAGDYWIISDTPAQTVYIVEQA